MTLVVDASVVVAALIDTGPDGEWAEATIGENVLVAPHLLLVEVANVLRRAVASQAVSSDVGSLAHDDLLRLPVHLFGYDGFGARVWGLRSNVTAYDAWYVAMAEDFDIPLATLDRRLAAAAGPHCTFVHPPAS